MSKYLDTHPFVHGRKETFKAGGVEVSVWTWKVNPAAYRKVMQETRKKLGAEVDEARAGAKAATTAFNKAKRAKGAEKGELDELRKAKTEAETRFQEAERAFAATKKASITDDDVYASDPELLEKLPRGCHRVTFADEAGNVLRVVWVRGLRKFNGLLSTDEDEDDAQTRGKDEATDPAAPEDQAQLPDGTATLYVMEKANGENCKFSLTMVDGTYYVLFGSKNTCRVLRLDASAEEVGAELGTDAAKCEYPWQNVGDVALRWLRQQTPETLKKLEDVVLCGELMRPWAEHLVRLTYGIELYAVSEAGVPADLATTRSMFAELGIEEGRAKAGAEMRCVACTVHPAADLAAVVDEVRELANSEGAVVYAVGGRATGQAAGPVTGQAAGPGALTYPVLALFKVKAKRYVVWRRVREIVKALVRSLVRGARDPGAEGAMSTSALVDDTKKRLRRGMSTLTHVPLCAVKCGQWGDQACAFVDYLVERFLRDGTVDDLAAAVRGKFATLVYEFETRE